MIRLEQKTKNDQEYLNSTFALITSDENRKL